MYSNKKKNSSWKHTVTLYCSYKCVTGVTSQNPENFDLKKVLVKVCEFKGCIPILELFMKGSNIEVCQQKQN